MSDVERLCSICLENPVLSRREIPVCRLCDGKERVKKKSELELLKTARRRSRGQRHRYKSNVPRTLRTAFINKYIVAGRTTTDIVQDLMVRYPEEDMKRLRNFVYVQRRRARKRMDIVPPMEPFPDFVPSDTSALFADEPMELAEEVVDDGLRDTE